MQTIYVTSRGLLRIQNRQLVIDGDRKVHIPVEDIASVVIESQQVTITSACLSFLAESGCNLIICGPEHKPSALQLPFLPHSRQAMVNRQQQEWDDPFRKRAHQNIIRAKLANQAEASRLLETGCSDELARLSRTVKLGDKTNVEAVGASLYFSRLLRGHSRREKGYYYNKAMNYGYAIIRARVAQALTAAGFIPSIGLFHRSELNNFNLADDLLEPFRPFVDLHIFSRFEKVKEELDREDKCSLLQLPEIILSSETGETIQLSGAIRTSVQSLRRASESKDAGQLSFPKLCWMEERPYE